jgi:hypothetical protein
VRERLQLYIIACIFHDVAVAILLHFNEIMKIDALFPFSACHSEILHICETGSCFEAEDRESRFPLFLIIGLRKRSEFYELSEEEGEDGPKMCGFSTISGIPR